MDMNEVQLPENVVALHETEGSGLDGRGHGSTQDLSGSEVIPDVITPYGAAVDSAILDEIVTAIRKYLYILEQDALLLTLSKFPNLIGMATYHWRRGRNAQMRIIEYK